MEPSSRTSPPNKATAVDESARPYNHLRTKGPPARGLSLLEDWHPASRKNSQSSEGQTGASQYQRNLESDLLERPLDSAYSRSLFEQSVTATEKPSEPFPSTSSFPLTQEPSSTTTESLGFVPTTAVRNSVSPSPSRAPGVAPSLLLDTSVYSNQNLLSPTSSTAQSPLPTSAPLSPINFDLGKDQNASSQSADSSDNPLDQYSEEPASTFAHQWDFLQDSQFHQQSQLDPNNGTYTPSYHSQSDLNSLYANPPTNQFDSFGHPEAWRATFGSDIVDSLSSYSGASRPASVAGSSFFDTPDHHSQDFNDAEVHDLDRQLSLFAPLDAENDTASFQPQALKVLQDEHNRQKSPSRDTTMQAPESDVREAPGPSVLGTQVYFESPAGSEKEPSEQGEACDEDLPTARPRPPLSANKLAALDIPTYSNKDYSMDGSSPMTGGTTAGPRTARGNGTNNIIEQMIADAEKHRKEQAFMQQQGDAPPLFHSETYSGAIPTNQTINNLQDDLQHRPPHRQRSHSEADISYLFQQQSNPQNGWNQVRSPVRLPSFSELGASIAPHSIDPNNMQATVISPTTSFLRGDAQTIEAPGPYSLQDSMRDSLIGPRRHSAAGPRPQWPYNEADRAYNFAPRMMDPYANQDMQFGMDTGAPRLFPGSYMGMPMSQPMPVMDQQPYQHDLPTFEPNTPFPFPFDNMNIAPQPSTSQCPSPSPSQSGRSHASSSTGAELVDNPAHWESQTTKATKMAAEARRKPGTDAKFKCDYCGESFTRAYNLKGHLRAHNGIKPFVCTEAGCDKAFARAHDLKRHQTLHTTVSKYKCLACERSFKRLDALQRHHRSEAGQQCVAQLESAQNFKPHENGTVRQAGAVYL